MLYLTSRSVLMIDEVDVLWKQTVAGWLLQMVSIMPAAAAAVIATDLTEVFEAVAETVPVFVVFAAAGAVFVARH